MAQLLAHPQIPYFNAPIYLQNKTQVGKVEEIFGTLNSGVRTTHAASHTFARFSPSAGRRTSHELLLGLGSPQRAARAHTCCMRCATVAKSKEYCLTALRHVVLECCCSSSLLKHPLRYL